MTLGIVLVLALGGSAAARHAAPMARVHSVRGVDSEAFFDKKARLSKALGATFVTITEGLPPAMWQFSSDDPYPGWFIYRPSLLKIFPPKNVAPFVDVKYADRIATILEGRCKILRKYGLKATFNSNEPQTLPEAFFVAYPELRGPRVDQPNRSRAAWWSPSVDEPQTLALYAEAMKTMLRRCPEIENFNFLTSDSGSGFDWVPGLYAGMNGNEKWKDRPMERRVSGFLINLQEAAKDAGHDITINLNPITPRQWMMASFSPEVSDAIVHALPRGLALGGREGPDGRPFGTAAKGGAFGGGGHEAFSPVVGIVVPGMGDGGSAGHASIASDVDGERPASADAAPAGDATIPYAPRISVDLGDETTIDFNYRMAKALGGRPGGNMIERLEKLRAFAAAEVGEQNADALLDVWNSLNRVEERLDVLNFGGMLEFGHVLNRWIDRPMVPFPEELSDAEKKDWRPFLFQAKGEEQADDLADIQAMRMYKGWGASMLFQRAIETTAPQVLDASRRIARIASGAKDANTRRFWDLYAIRLEAAYCLLESADHMVSYQAQLDRARELGAKPENNPPLGAQSDWARTDMMDLARKEIDTMIRLRQILQSTSEPILETAQDGDRENVMRLGPAIADQIKNKIDTMNRHWRDYDRIFTVPNP
jgi:hypothetical protein